ncbi:MAG TPA: DUF456 domain-containing protein [Tahibacter sp.]|uniref:DUF456 domain-containing protein n=1 Tax=Tahibacter sp. TaxID=2056211 RepID=UPI002C44E790|nr:DUF456 domain-containing protein [Tahibacter sp.]HSX59501.1 DUF456 domain-containing protein [Tahibacter sp.]
MTIVLYVLAAAMIVVGLLGTVLPALPGVPLLFAGMFLAAWADNFVHVGPLTLGILALLCALAIAADIVASLLGAKRVGASTWALFGAAIGTFAGFFFGIPGLVLGPFIGALAGELIAGSTVRRAAHVGVGTWLGLLFGTLVKVALAFAMIGIFAFALLIPA